MSDNVVKLAPAAQVIKPVDDAVVATLEGMLARAKAGEVQGVLMATIETDGAGSVLSVGTVYAGEGVNRNVHAAIGAAAALQARFTQDRLEWR